MAFPNKLSPTKDHNSFLSSPKSFTGFSESSLLQQLHTTHRVTVRQSESTRSWNSTFASLLTNGKMTGMTCYHWPSSNTITTCTWPHNRPFSCWIQGGTPEWALNHTKQIREWRQSMSSRTEWRSPSRRPNQLWQSKG